MLRATIIPLVVVLAVLSAAAFAGIEGTVHDFSSESWSEGRICLPCHVSHNAMTDEGRSSMVLWNHTVSSETFVMYASFLEERTDRDLDEQPGGASKLCLSCHDGATAIDSYGGGPESPSVYAETSLGSDLRDDHPIGVQYPSDGYPGYQPRANLPPIKLVAWGEKNDRVECTSCHDAHSDDFGMFLLMDNTGDALCLQCHDK